MTSVIVTSSLCEREHLRSMCPPIRALTRIVLSLTKPKDKIYPTENDNIKKILPQLYNIYSIRHSFQQNDLRRFHVEHIHKSDKNFLISGNFYAGHIICMVGGISIHPPTQ